MNLISNIIKHDSNQQQPPDAPGKTLVVIPTFECAKPQRTVMPATTDDECLFERFPELPLELRQQIYEESRPEPRILRFGFEEVMVNTTVEKLSTKGEDLIRVIERHRSKSKRSKVFGLRHLKSAFEKISRMTRLVRTARSSKPSDNATSLPWALLAVNKETREWAKRRYQLSFEGELSSCGGVYIDFARDTLLFLNNKAFQAMFAAVENRDTSGIEDNGRLSWPIHNSTYKVDKVVDQVQQLAIQDELAANVTATLAKFPSLSQVHLLEFPYSFPSARSIQVLLISIWRLQREMDIFLRETSIRLLKELGLNTEGDDSVVKFLKFPEVKAWTLWEFQQEFHR